MKLKKIIFLVVMFLIPIVKISAASFNLGASSRTVTVGSNVTIYVNGSDVTGKVNISSSNASVLSSNSNTLWIEPSGSITFNAKKVGSSTITVTGASLSDGAGNDVDLGSKSITINVVEKQAPKSVSSNNSLKSLNIEGYDLEPIFEAGTTEYNVTVKEGTESINLSAVPEDNNASVNGTGTIQVSEGLNVIKVTVTAENGYQKEYILNVNVDEEPITVRINDIDYNLIKQANSLPQVSSYYSLSNMEYKYMVDGEEKTIDIPTYISEVTGYILVGIKDKKGNTNLYIYNNDKFTLYKELTFNSNIVIYPKKPKKILDGFKLVKLDINNIKVDAYQSDTSSNYYLIYGINVDNNEENWYKYDKNDNSIQRYDYEELDNLKKENHKYLMTTYIMTCTTLLLLLSIMILIFKIRNVKR